MSAKKEPGKLRRAIHGAGSDIKIVLEFFRLIHKLDKTCVWVVLAQVVTQAVTPLITVLIPKLIIDELMGLQRWEYFTGLIIGAAVVMSVLHLISRKLNCVTQAKCLEVQEKCRTYLGNRVMAMDYENLEDPQVLDVKNKAVLPLLSGGIWGTVGAVMVVMGNFITMLGLAALIATLNIGIILLMVVMVFVNMALYKKSQALYYEVEKRDAELERELDYYEKLTGDFSMGKDVRIYGIRPLILGKIKDLQQRIRQFMEKGLSKCAWMDGSVRALSQIQIVVVYIYMTYRVLLRGLSIADFTMYINAANTFSTSLSGFFDSLVWLRQMTKKAVPFLEFVDVHPKKSDEGKTTEGITECEIEFQNVSFKYPRGDQYILKDVSITIRPGEKLSVVGLNGAGKTTFIKLLARLYDPDEGRILINGIDIREFGYQEYMKLLAVVFQDFKTFAFSIRENVALEHSGIATDDRVWDALERAGLSERMKSLPKGLDTCLYKIFDEDGIEFSGGQNQKLAIARAIYKDAPVVILDEPTAALDPMSEYEIYSHFNQLIGAKTTIYISHRLSSCRFCDRIAVFADGTVSQCGTHEELIAQKGSQYEQMYSAQAQYYV